MHVGADVIEGFPVAEAQTKTKTNIFAQGYESGSRITIGASLKGRVWSYRVASSLKHWIDWCNHIGSKLVDDGLSVDEVMRNFIRPEIVEVRPHLVPLALEWTWEVAAGTSEEVRVEFGGSGHALADLELELTAHEPDGLIPFQVSAADWSAGYTIELGNGVMRFTAVGQEAEIVSRDQRIPLSAFLDKAGLYIHFEHEALILPPAFLLKPPRDLPPFDAAALTALDWSGVDLRVEFRGQSNRTDLIQHRMIRHVESLGDWDVILDDDGPGEIADIVALRTEGDELRLHFTHCKYVTGGAPGARVEDLYVVCGQAQKSARWRRNIPVFLARLLAREKRRLHAGRRTGFVKGDARALYSLADTAHLLRPALTTVIAQPGLSRSAASPQQLELLAATEVFVRETANSALEVYCSN